MKEWISGEWYCSKGGMKDESFCVNEIKDVDERLLSLN